jgi:hypothetical protein
VSGFQRTAAAPTGSTGNNNHAGVGANPSADKVALEVIVEAIGATPTVTYKLQATLDDDSVADAFADWFDVELLPAASETAVATDTKTAVGVYVYYLAQSAVRFGRRYRLVTSANTNVTYRANVHQQLR